ncbi:MAG: response regulator [Deltaproteobacteria bacterium]|nr:response regulator [Deltaproteobacteria bacterium]MBW2395068.1 response regulator [Deltaproteobacteria bacterium]
MPKTLLLADDSVTIQKVVGISFANEDVDLVTVDNGDDAVARARELQPDLILADVVMPGLSGYEVCHAIKSDPVLSRIPVLLLTGTFETFDEAKANEVGADGHITKPFEAQALVDQVNALLANSPTAAASSPSAEPEPLGLTGLATPGAGPEPYDLFEDDVTAPSGTADAALLDSPPTTVMMGGEPLEQAMASGSSSMTSSDDIASDANALTSDDFATGSDLFAPADAPFAPVDDALAPVDDPLAPIDDPQDGTVLLDPASGGSSVADLLTSEDDVLESGEPLENSPLVTAKPDLPNELSTEVPGDGPNPADAILLEDDFSDPITPQAPNDPGAAQGSADLFAVSEGSGFSEFSEQSEVPPVSDPVEASDPLGSSDPGGTTTVLSEPLPAPDAPTVFEFGGPEGAAAQDPTLESSPAFASEPHGAAVDADLFAEEVRVPAPPDLFAEDNASASPDLFAAGGESAGASLVSDAGQSPSPGMLDDDPLGQTTLDPEAGRSYDVSSSDLGASLTGGTPAPIVLPSEPNWPADPEGAETASSEVEPERHEATPPALSPMLEQQVHDAVEKMAWDAFGDLAERIIKDAVERIEKVAWEVIPQMTETLIQEEIRKLKNEK